MGPQPFLPSFKELILDSALQQFYLCGLKIESYNN